MGVTIIQIAEWTTSGLELCAVLIIGVAFAYGIVRFLFRARFDIDNAYDSLKAYLGRALLLGLEFLVAADVIRTVAVAPTMQNVLLLGLLVVIRTFLSWSVVVEIEGDWPWRLRRTASSTDRLNP
jgi:uncharacterized membrane protein